MPNILPQVNDLLIHLAFDNSAQPNIISVISTGKIIAANKAACKLLGYSMKEILTRNRSSIFDIHDAGFKKMLKERSAEGQAIATVKLIHKKGTVIPCEISSAVFTGEHGIKKSITSITNLTASIERQHVIDTKNEKIVSDNIDIAILKEQKSAIHKQKIVAKDIASAIDKQKSTDKRNEKRVADNIKIASDASNEKTEASNTWIKYIAQTSYDVMWDWNIVTGNVYIGDSMEEVFGYKIKNNHIDFTEFKKAVLTPDSAKVLRKLVKTLKSAATSWSDSFSIKRLDGSLAYVNSRGSIVRNDEGKAIRMIGATQDVSRIRELELHVSEQAAGAIHDLSRQKELEEKLALGILSAGKLLAEHKENLRMLFNSSSDVLYDIDLVTDEIILSEGYEKEFGYAIVPHMKTADVWGKHLHPDDRSRVMADYHRMLKSQETKWSCQYRFLKADGSAANILSSRIILRSTDGKACRMIGSMQDISKQTVLEEKLEQEIHLKEKQIHDAMQDANESARSDIGKELHDNVNQLLGVSRLYLEMAKRGGPDSAAHLNRSSEYTMNAIEEIRKLTRGLSTDSIKVLGLCTSVENLARVAMEVNPVVITCILDPFIEDRLNDKFKLNIFRIIQEHLNNILKHAAAKNVNITLSQNKVTIILTVEDDGVGFDTAKKTKGVGVDNIKSRAAACNGHASFISSAGKGCSLTILFTITDALLKKN